MESIAASAVSRFSDLYEEIKRNEKQMEEGRKAALHFRKLGLIVQVPEKRIKPGRKPKKK